MREMSIAPYDARWPEDYEREKAILMEVLGSHVLDMQHFGSTSIPGMTAKPTIDIMVIVRCIDEIDKLNAKMTERGYKPRGENGIPGRRYFVRFKDDGENHAAHIHIYGPGNPHIADELVFRDFLRVNKDAFLKYENVKKMAAEKYRFEPREYTDAKADCVAEIMRQARQYYKLGGIV